jgi:hypothetical protein
MGAYEGKNIFLHNIRKDLSQTGSWKAWVPLLPGRMSLKNEKEGRRE